MHYNLLAAAAINPSARLLVALLFCCSCALSLQPLVTTRGACDIPSDSKVCPDACLAALAEIKNVADEVRWFARQDASALVAGSCHPDGMGRGPRDSPAAAAATSAAATRPAHPPSLAVPGLPEGAAAAGAKAGHAWHPPCVAAA